LRGNRPVIERFSDDKVNHKRQVPFQTVKQMVPVRDTFRWRGANDQADGGARDHDLREAAW
jgi:hypothetical protein